MSAVSSFAEMVKTRRKQLGLTQEELADRMLINRVTLARIESNKKTVITIQTADAFFRHLGISWVDYALKVHGDNK